MTTRTFCFAFTPSWAAAVLGSGVLWAAAQAAQPQPQPQAPVPAPPSAQELAQRHSDRAAERANIAHQRAVVRAELAEREKGCWQKFAVEDCLRKARTQAREQERVLRERDLMVNRQERQERADLRLGEIARKQADRPLPAPMDSTARPPLPSAADVQQAERSRAQEAQQRAQAQQQRQRAHDAEVQAREASEAQRRAQAAREYADKQREAAERRAAKQADIDGRTGQPLALPPGVPAP